MSKAILREIRELTRHPPLRHDDAMTLVQAVVAGMQVSTLHEVSSYPERRDIRYWRKTYAYFDQAMVGAEAVQEFKNIARITYMVQAGTPATVQAIRRKTGCTPREAKRWLKAVAAGPAIACLSNE